MQKIATPQDLQTKLRRLLAYCQEPHPSRDRLAGELRGLADRVAATKGRGRVFAARDLGKILKEGVKGNPAKQVERHWEDVVKGFTEAKRQYDAMDSVGGRLDDDQTKEITKRFLVGPLKRLGETATGWGESFEKDAR